MVEATKEPINKALVMRQMDTNALRKEFGSVSAQAARVQAQMISGSPVDDTAESKSIIDPLTYLRNYQACLVDLCIDGKLEKDKFATHMQSAHA